MLRNKEDSARFAERWVDKSIVRPAGNLIWLHVASVGEALSALPLIEKILDEISFSATDRSGEKIIINKDYINKNLDNLVKDTDLSKFILYFN